MSRVGDWLAGPHKAIDVSAGDGGRYRVVARKKRFRETEPIEKIFVPAGLTLLWELFRELRWNVVDRRHYVVEVFVQGRPQASPTLMRSVEVGSRRRAYEVLDGE